MITIYIYFLSAGVRAGASNKQHVQGVDHRPMDDSQTTRSNGTCKFLRVAIIIVSVLLVSSLVAVAVLVSKRQPDHPVVHATLPSRLDMPVLADGATPAPVPTLSTPGNGTSTSGDGTSGDGTTDDGTSTSGDGTSGEGTSGDVPPPVADVPVADVPSPVVDVPSTTEPFTLELSPASVLQMPSRQLAR